MSTAEELFSVFLRHLVQERGPGGAAEFLELQAAFLRTQAQLEAHTEAVRERMFPRVVLASLQEQTR